MRMMLTFPWSCTVVLAAVLVLLMTTTTMTTTTAFVHHTATTLTALVVRNVPPQISRCNSNRDKNSQRKGKTGDDDDDDDFYADYNPSDYSAAAETRAPSLSSSSSSSFAAAGRGGRGRGGGNRFGSSSSSSSGGRGRREQGAAARGGGGAQAAAAPWDPYSYSSYSGSTSSSGRSMVGHDYERDTSRDTSNVDLAAVNDLIAARLAARKSRDFDQADAIRDELLETHGVMMWDRERIWRSGASKSGSGTKRPMSSSSSSYGNKRQQDPSRATTTRRPPRDFGPNGHDYYLSPDAGDNVSSLSESEIHDLIAQRLECKMSRDFQTADLIQEQLNAAGVAVHDAKKEWRADGQMFGGGGGGGESRGRDRDGRGRDGGESRRRERTTTSTPRMAFPYEQSEYSVASSSDDDSSVIAEIQALVEARSECKAKGDYDNADDIREQLRQNYQVWVDDRLRQWSIGGDFGPEQIRTRGAVLLDSPYTVSIHSQPCDDEEMERVIAEKVEQRRQAKKDRDFETADAIRDVLRSEYNVYIEDRQREWSVGGDFGMPRDDDNNARQFNGRNDYSNNNNINKNQRGYVQNQVVASADDLSMDQLAAIQAMVDERAQAKADRDFDTADALREELLNTYNVFVEDRRKEWAVGGFFGGGGGQGSYFKGCSTTVSDSDMAAIVDLIAQRSQAKKERDFDTADRLRDELRQDYSVIVDDKTREWRIQSGGGGGGGGRDGNRRGRSNNRYQESRY